MTDQDLNRSQEDVEEFLRACGSSSAAAYEQFKELLARLEDPATRAQARRFLSRLVAAVAGRDVEENLAAFHFGFQELPTGREGHGGPPLTMLQFPSVFTPEQWSRTFFEGLARLPSSDLAGRNVAELGAGSGWISLALARRAAPAKVYGLDLNPKAVTCARINLYLNGLDSEGAPLRDGDGKTLLDRVEFHVSDLLTWVRQQGLELDRVVGCIPQVLDPDLATTVGAISDTASDELLHSLSNYTSRQGYLEDQFGLGLIARALDESVQVLRPNGRVVFNLGGRPGRSILLHLFRRRGFEVQEIWKTRIQQAADTDISPLAEIETSSSHRFEFFLTPHSDEPVSARTARAYQQAGGPIYHALTVVEGRPRFPEALRRLYRILSRPEYSRARGALDLAYEEEPVAEEKTVFLGRLAGLLDERSCFPYERTPGTQSFRSHFAQFLRLYFRLPLAEDCFVVAPSRATALRNLFNLYAPARSLVHPLLLTAPPAAGGGEVLECPTRVDLACKLIEALQPQLVVTTLAANEVGTPDSFLRLLETAGRTGARLVVDISPFLELASAPEVNGVHQALAEARLPEHVAILCGLVKNQVYQDLEACFVISENRNLLQALTAAAEVTYSRTPLLVQDYYDTLLTELLSFRLDSSHPAGDSKIRHPEQESQGAVSRVPMAERCRRAFAHPAITAERLPISAETVRLDYGENSLASPAFVKASLLESFVRRVVSPAEVDLAPEISFFLRRRFGLNAGKGTLSRFAFGLGVAPLFSALAESCAAEGGTFVFPSGAYDYFLAAVEFFGSRWDRIATRRENGFKVTPDALDEALARAPRPWLFLNGPVVNPTGSLYSAEEIAALLDVATRHRARIVLDILFSGLELEEPPEPWDLEPLLQDQPTDLVVLGGISKELAAGGLRFGFACCRSDAMAKALTRGLSAVPHATMLYAAKKIYANLNHPTLEVRNELETQRSTLRRHTELLSETLAETGWEPLTPRGGLFLVARPTAYLSHRVRVETPHGTKEYILDSENLPEALFYATGLLINNSVWTGLPEHCRFVHSVPEEQLQEGIERLRLFRERVLGG
ncbi:MAG TPA: aminotransferase class I/II-fold pyridoxal phosphate-dependent enzyme [Thermoanaerobaculia bacterium]